ncbi:ABC transporter permease [Streptomyces sp. NPDC046887]|uniref:ABC transporter permease n=1 Tax=Streptomyces sp. NPDC046887 TaxID=3155472 RepID=UPI0033FF0101
MLTLVISDLRARWASFLGGFTALALGVGLVAAIGLGLAASLDPPPRPPQRFGTAPVVVSGHDTLTVHGRRLALFHPQPVDTALIRELRALGPVSTDPTDPAVPTELTDLTDPAKEHHGAPTVVDAVGVHADPAAVRRVVGARARVLTGDERRQADPRTARDAEALVTVNALLGTAGGVTAFVSVFVTAATFAFAVALRRREFGLLRTVGATPGQVRRALLAEASVVGAIASAAGCALGAWGAPYLVRELVAAGLAPGWFRLGEATWPLHLSFWTGLLMALAGAWAAARRAGRTAPVEALREADVDERVLPPGRLLLGAALLLTGLGLLGWTLLTDPADLLKRKTYTTQPMLLIGGAALLSPLLVRPLLRRLPLPGTLGELTAANAAAGLRRTTAVAAPVLATVALAGSLLGSAASVPAAKTAEARQQTRASHIITPAADGNTRPAAPGPGALPNTPLPGALSNVSLPGAVLSPTASTGLFIPDGPNALVRHEARAVADPAAFARLSRLPVVAGNIRDLDDGSVIVSEEIADGEARAGPSGTASTYGWATAPRPRCGSRRCWRPAPEATAPMSPPPTPRRRPWTGSTHCWSRAPGQRRCGRSAAPCGPRRSTRTPPRPPADRAGATRGQVLRTLAAEALLATALGTVLGAAVTAVQLGGLAAALAALSAPVAIAVPWAALGAAVIGCALVAAMTAVLSAPAATPAQAQASALSPSIISPSPSSVSARTSAAIPGSSRPRVDRPDCQCRVPDSDG